MLLQEYDSGVYSPNEADREMPPAALTPFHGVVTIARLHGFDATGVPLVVNDGGDPLPAQTTVALAQRIAGAKSP